MAEEILGRWKNRIEGLTLRPSRGGRFEVSVNGKSIFSKAELGRHAEAGEVAGRLEELIGASEGH
ncbi:SelT/SelW/selH family protein [Limnochorda pilosa]|uniref:SelT/SelW/selH family protein n=1 Tax=Limnochorda pilosa TaxID=1555112 RepID=A0A0K2SJD0_LIMPI|nr:SelT/SelW/selH family protein [Limnochorda pilosa]